jgi:hypothetical protein
LKRINPRECRALRSVRVLDVAGNQVVPCVLWRCEGFVFASAKGANPAFEATCAKSRAGASTPRYAS